MGSDWILLAAFLCFALGLVVLWVTINSSPHKNKS